MMTGKTVIATTIGSLMLSLMVGNAEAQGSIKMGAELSADCTECHGMDGKGNSETTAIAGLDKVYMFKKLRGFRNGRITSPDGTMHTYTQNLSDQDLWNLAAYWSSLRE